MNKLFEKKNGRYRSSSIRTKQLNNRSSKKIHLNNFYDLKMGLIKTEYQADEKRQNRSLNHSSFRIKTGKDLMMRSGNKQSLLWMEKNGKVNSLTRKPNSNDSNSGLGSKKFHRSFFIKLRSKRV
jgi:uncharacterized protein YggL (DUF469 family)